MRKQIFKLLPLVAAAFLATSCDKNDEPTAPVQTVCTPSQPQTTYTLTITATKGTNNSLTKALALNGDNIDATWKKGETVSVYQNGRNIGNLTAQSDGATTTEFSGNLTEKPSLGQAILKYKEPNYYEQEGTLESIAKNLDCAEATITITGVTEDQQILTSEGTATFKNQQAIVKFTLKSGSNIINAKRIIINGIAITPETPTHEIYAALPGCDEVSIFVNDGTNYYTYATKDDPNCTAGDAKLENGKYYKITVTKLATSDKIVDLAKLTSNYKIPDGSIVSGKLNGNYKITIAPNATVTLVDATINGTNNSAYRWAGITCEGNATIILEGENTVTGFDGFYPGIFIPQGSTLTIDGTGSLTASSNDDGASHGIGGGYNGFDGDGGNIIINGGTINATIGNGGNANCGDITINGGTVKAISQGSSCAGIGGNRGGVTVSCGNITITGGKVEAQGGDNGPGIGAGSDCGCGNITITGGDVKAIGSGDGAGIGSCNSSGYSSYCGAITIAGGKVEAQGRDYAPGIGAGKGGECGNITISGGSVTATGSGYAAGIGSTNTYSTKFPSSCGDITIINGVTSLNITKGENATYSIGKGNDDNSTCGTVKIFGVEGAITDSPYIYPSHN